MRTLKTAMVRGMGLLTLIVAATLLYLTGVASSARRVALQHLVDMLAPRINSEALLLFAHQASVAVFMLMTVTVMTRQARRSPSGARRLAGLCQYLSILIGLCLVVLAATLTLTPGVPGFDTWQDPPWRVLSLFDDLASLTGNIDALGAVLVALWLMAAAALATMDHAGMRVTRLVTALALIGLIVVLWPRHGLLIEALPEPVRIVFGRVGDLAFLPAMLTLLASLSFSLSIRFRPALFYLAAATVLAIISTIDLHAAARASAPDDTANAALHLRMASLIVFGFLAAAAARFPSAGPASAFGAHAVALIVLMILVKRMWAIGSQLPADMHVQYGRTLDALHLATGVGIIVAVAIAGRIALDRSARPRPVRRAPGLPAISTGRALVIAGPVSGPVSGPMNDLLSAPDTIAGIDAGRG